jgi:hypothetical protein
MAAEQQVRGPTPEPGARQMTDRVVHDPEAVRAGRLFADLMLTLAEDGVSGAEAVALTTPLSAALQTLDLTTAPQQQPRLCPETTVAGLTVVCGMLADQLVTERRERGQDTCLVSVWSELVAAMQTQPGCGSTG